MLSRREKSSIPDYTKPMVSCGISHDIAFCALVPKIRLQVAHAELRARLFCRGVESESSGLSRLGVDRNVHGRFHFSNLVGFALVLAQQPAATREANCE